MRVVVLHAYSARNRGDRWLVELTHELLKDAGHEGSEVETFAIDPSSFNGDSFLGKFRSSSDVFRLNGKFRDLGLAIGSIVSGQTAVRRAVARADLVLGVGGGYLRAGNFKEGMRTLFAHVPQLFISSRSHASVIYLPQSIGPLKGLAGKLIGNLLNDIDLVFVRDDTSMKEVPSAQRMPDLAALKLGKTQPKLAEGNELVLSVRPVGADCAHEKLRRLNVLLRPQILGVQSRGGKNEDLPLTESIALPGQAILPMVEASKMAGVVVAVRLHAAMGSIAAGVPAIHLSYERKGWGVFEDLGMLDFVHDVRTFDPELVARQVREVSEDRSTYWARLEDGLDRLNEDRSRLVSLISGMRGRGIA